MPRQSTTTTADPTLSPPAARSRDPSPFEGDIDMNELTQTQLLERVTEANRPSGNPRVQKITARIIGDLFRAIDDLDVSPDEFWVGVDWLSRLGQTGQIGLITAGLGFDRLLDIRADETDRRAGRTA